MVWFILGWLSAVALIAPLLVREFRDNDPDFL